MPEYRRFIAYFYEYINGKKQKNAGFAKVELRNGMWRILLRLTTGIWPESPIQVYGFVRESGYLLGFPLGTIRPVKEVAEEWAFRADAPVGRGMYRLEDFAGIWIESADGRKFLTVWDDEPVDLGKFVMELPKEEQGEPAEERPEAAGEPAAGDPVPEVQGAREIRGERLETAGERAVREPEVPQEEKTQDGLAWDPVPEVQGAMEIRGEGLEIAGESEAARERAVRGPEVPQEEKTQDGLAWDPVPEVQGAMEIRGEGLEAAGEPETAGAENEIAEEIMGGKGALEDKTEVSGIEEALERKTKVPGRAARFAGEEWTVPYPAERMSEEDSETAGAEDEIAEEKAFAGEPEATQGEKTQDGLAGEPALEEQGAREIRGERLETAGEPETAETKKDVSAEKLEAAETAERISAEGQTRAWEAGREREAEPPRGCIGELFERRRRFQPFGDREIVNCVMIMPCDIVRMQQENWRVGRGSFLQHGFYLYRHLLLGMTGDGAYVLGVPGIQTPHETYMAQMFGFDRFKVSRIHNGRQVFGYWYRRLEKCE